VECGSHEAISTLYISIQIRECALMEKGILFLQRGACLPLKDLKKQRQFCNFNSLWVDIYAKDMVKEDSFSLFGDKSPVTMNIFPQALRTRTGPTLWVIVEIIP